MKRDDFSEALRELDRELETTGMPAEVDARLRARLEQPARRSSWGPLVLAVAAATVIVAFLLVPRAPRTVSGFTVESSSGLEVVVDGAALSVTAGEARLRDESLAATLVVKPGVVLTRARAGVELREGQVRLEVARLAGRVASYAVTVSDGVIELDGATVVVEQRATGGRVEALEGVARFVARDGRVVQVTAKEPLTWPLPSSVAAPQPPSPSPVAPVAAPQPRPRVALVPPAPAPVAPPTVAPGPPFSSEAVLARVAGLRSRRAYEEAVQVLGAALREAPNDATRERLGFELGSLLTHQLHDTARACAFWSAFRLEHVNGRYDAEVRATVESLGCAGGK